MVEAPNGHLLVSFVNDFGSLEDLVSRFPVPHSICYGVTVTVTNLPRRTTLLQLEI